MKRYQAHVLLLIMALIYSGNFPIAKSLFEPHLHINSGELVLIRVVFASISFWIIDYFFLQQEERPLFSISTFLLPGLLLAILSQLLFFLGLQYTSPTSASIMRLSTPISVFILALIIKQEHFDFRKMIGIGLGTLGALIAILGTSYEFSILNIWSPATWKGDVLVFLSAIAFGAYTICAKKLIGNDYHPVTVLKWSFTFGAIFLIYTYFFLGQLPLNIDFSLVDIRWDLFTTWDYVALFYFLFFATFATFLINITTLKILDASTVGFYTLLLPLFTAIISVCFFGDILSWSMVIGGIFILGGIILIYGFKIIHKPLRDISNDIGINKEKKSSQDPIAA